MPAGSTDEKGFPGEKGFGHEEWNFQLEDEVEGYIYGYMYSSPSIADREEFRLYFYSIHPDTKDRLLVGCYKAAKLVAADEYKNILDRFRSRGILHRRARELVRVIPNMRMRDAQTEIENSLEKSWLKVKCPVESVDVFEPPIRLSKSVGDKTLSHRFRMFTYVDEKHLLSKIKPSSDHFKEDRVDLAEDGYFRESRENLKEIIPRHNALSNALCKWLESRGIEPKQEKQGVDVEFQHGGCSYRVEIKTTYGSGVRHSLREAIGQLLEYNLYPGRYMCDKWVVLLDCKPGGEHVEYVRSLREQFKLPLHIAWRNKEEFKFCDPGLGDF